MYSEYSHRDYVASLRQSALFSCAAVCWENSVPTSLPPDLKVIENIISPEEERKMLESIDWRGDENTQNGGQNQRNFDLPYVYPVILCSFWLEELCTFVNVLFENLLYFFFIL